MEFEITRRIRSRLGSVSELDYYFLFFIWPFLGLLIAFQYFRCKWAKNLIWLYTIYFGFTFVIPNNEVDASRYRDALIMMRDTNFSLEILFSSYFSADSGMLDIAQRLLTFIISRFTDDYRFLFAAFGLFLGYFLSRMIWLLIEKTSDKLDLLDSLILISFSLVVGIWDIGGFRFSVATLVFVYGVLQYLLNSNKGGLFISISTIFIHWSFGLALAVLFIYLLVKNKLLIYFGIFVLSYLISELNLDAVRNIFSRYAPLAVTESRGSYLNEYYIQGLADRSGSIAWYISGHVQALRWYVFGFAVYYYLWGIQKIREDKQLVSLFSFSLLFYGIFNSLSSIPSMMRFIEVGNLFMLAFLFSNIVYIKNKMPIILKFVGIPVLLLFIAVRMRMGLDYIGMLAIIGSPLYIYFTENSVALIDMVKGNL